MPEHRDLVAMAAERIEWANFLATVFKGDSQSIPAEKAIKRAVKSAVKDSSTGAASKKELKTQLQGILSRYGAAADSQPFVAHSHSHISYFFLAGGMFQGSI